jgi:hypothetical protein
LSKHVNNTPPDHIISLNLKRRLHGVRATKFKFSYDAEKCCGALAPAFARLFAAHINRDSRSLFYKERVEIHSLPAPLLLQIKFGTGAHTFYDSRTLRALSSFFIIHTLFNEQERTRDDRLHGCTVVHPQQQTRNPFRRREVVVDNVIINPCLRTITHNSSPVVSGAVWWNNFISLIAVRGHAIIRPFIITTPRTYTSVTSRTSNLYLRVFIKGQGDFKMIAIPYILHSLLTSDERGL